MRKIQKLVNYTYPFLVAALGVSLNKLHNKQKENKLLKENLRKSISLLEKKETELLQKKGHTHFIKNSIAIIKSYIEEEKETNSDSNYSIESIDVLGKIIKHFTYIADKDYSNFGDELHLIDLFIKFINLKSDNKYKIVLNRDSSIYNYSNYNICCCIFAELLENAYKHAYKYPYDNIINIDIKMADDNYLVFRIENPVYISRRNSIKNKYHQGLDILNKRLAIFYKNTYEINKLIKQNRYKVELIIELKKNWNA